MTPFLLGALLAITPIQDRDAVKNTLQNGVVIYAQKLAGSDTVSVSLSLNLATGQESAETHGIRHLLEHLAARGKSQVVDKILEPKGMVLLAETTRDSVNFTITGKKQFAPEMQQAIQAILDYEVEPDEKLQHEVAILTEELALRSWSTLLVSDGWKRAYGENALDPFGDIELLKKVTTKEVIASWEKLRDPKFVSFAVIGDIEPESMTKSWIPVFAKLRSSGSAERSLRSLIEKPVLVGSDEGESVCAPMDTFGTPDSIVTIAAAMGIRAWTSDCQITYVPSGQKSLIQISWPSSTGFKGAKSQLLGKEASAAETGTNLVQEWLAESANDSQVLAKLASTILNHYPSFDPRGVSKLAEGIDPARVAEKIRTILNAGDGS